MARVTGRCLNADCKVCALMNKLDKASLAALGEVRNTPLTVMIDLAPFITQCLNSGEISEERRQVLVITLLFEKQTSIFGKCWLPRHDLSTVETPAAREGMGGCVV